MASGEAGEADKIVGTGKLGLVFRWQLMFPGDRVVSRAAVGPSQRGANPPGCLWLLRRRAEQPECCVFVYLGMFPSPRSLGCRAAPCFSVRMLRLVGPTLGPCSAEGFSGLLRVAGVSPPIDGEVDAQEGAGHHTPPLVNDSWI